MPSIARALLFLLPVLPVSAAALAAQAAPRGAAAVRGTLTDASGRPVAGVLVARMRSSDSVRTDSLGRYAVERLPLGTHLFAVRHRSFEDVDFQVTFTSDTSVTVDIPLEPRAGAAPYAGDAGGDKLTRVGFAARREREGRRLTFYTGEDIAARAAVRFSQMFEGVRDVSVRMEGGIPVLFGHDRRCVMNVWVEGRRVDNAFPSSATTGGSSRRSSTAIRYTGLDEIVPLADIAGVEVYPRPSQVPEAFQRSATVTSGRDFSTTSGECGALVIWTR